MTDTAKPRPHRPGLSPGLVSVVAMLVLWAVASQLTDRPQTLPAPWEVAARIGRLAASGELWFNSGMTLMRVGLSFALAMVTGMALGLAMGRSRRADEWLNPALIIGLNVPALVVIVLCYIWIGLNETAAIAAVALNKIPLVTVMIREGARALRPDLDEMARAFRMAPMARLRHVVLPQLAPQIAAAARAGISLIWKIVLVVEFLGRSNGVGFQIHMYFQLFDVSMVMAYAVSFVVVMLVIEMALIRPIEQRAGSWRRRAALA